MEDWPPVFTFDSHKNHKHEFQFKRYAFAQSAPS